MMQATIEQTTVECVVHHLAAGREDTKNCHEESCKDYLQQQKLRAEFSFDNGTRKCSP